MYYQTQIQSSTFKSTQAELIFLDIETTGLSSTTDTISTLSLLRYSQDTLLLHQWVLEKDSEEETLLVEVIPYFKTGAIIYTYGSFDQRFLLEKCQTYGVTFPDIQRFVNLKKLPTFSTLSTYGITTRSTLERLLGFTRTLGVSGRELAKLGKLHLTTPQASYRQLLLGHSQEEVLSLLCFYQCHQFLLALSPQHLSTLPTQLSADETLLFSGTATYPFPNPLALTLGYYCFSYSPDSNQFKLTLSPFKGICYHPLPSKDYVIVNGELMHRSLAQFIPASLKRKAKKEECHLAQEGIFFSCNVTTSERLFYDSKKHPFILFSSDCDVLCLFNSFLKMWKFEKAH